MNHSADGISTTSARSRPRQFVRVERAELNGRCAATREHRTRDKDGDEDGDREEDGGGREGEKEPDEPAELIMESSLRSPRLRKPTRSP